MRWFELTEAPIEIATHDFDKSDGSFSDRDTRLHTNPKAVEKIKKVWHTSAVDLNLFLLNRTGVKPNEAIANSFFGDTQEVEAKAHESGFDLDPQAINCILTNNFGGSSEVPLTGWMIAHRLWHAITGAEKWAYRTENGELVKALNDICSAYGCGVYDLVACAIGRSRACREQLLTQYSELLPEMFAEFLFTGKVVLNRIPDVLVSKHTGVEYEIREDGYGGRAWKEIADEKTAEFEQWVNTHYKELVQHALGKCYVL